MIKAFYKRTKPIKTFFNKNVKLRSTAYGEDVCKDFLQWLSFYAKSQQTHGTGFRLSVEARPEGSPLAAQKNSVAGGLPALGFAGASLTLSTSGQVMINNTPCALNVGTETKAWAIAAIPHANGQHNALFVIGKPHGVTQMMLAVYPIKSGVPQAAPVLTHELPITLQASTYLVCLGRHIFAVHDSRLHYFHYLYETNELECVALGADTVPAAQPWGRHVYPLIVATQAGDVFWRTEHHVYGFSIGTPSKLITISVPKSEKLLHINGDKNNLQIHYQNKNTNAITTAYYDSKNHDQA